GLKESLEQWVLRRTKEFNKETRSSPEVEDLWMDFADFQDEAVRIMHGDSVLPSSSQAVMQMITEKRAAVVEGGIRHNPSSVRLRLEHLRLMGQLKEHKDVDKMWRRAIDKCDQSCMLWMGYLHFKRGHFDSFSVPDQRDLYSEGLHALQHTRKQRKADKIKQDRDKGVFVVGKSMLRGRSNREDYASEADMLKLLWDYCMMEVAAG
ncbi:unnamed protein product, partial [Choristocarpus tenellus]